MYVCNHEQLEDVAYLKLLFRYAYRETEGKYFNAVYLEKIPQRRQYTTTGLEWIIIRSINIKKNILTHWFQNSVPIFCP